MDPEDFDDFDDYDDGPQPVYESKTLTQGSPIVIETLNESMFIGEVIAITQPGIILLQKMAEVRPEELQGITDDSDIDYTLSNPIETFIPFMSIHYIQSVADISAESLIEQFRDDLDNYHNPTPETEDKEEIKESEETEESPEEETSPTKRWDQFIHILDRILKKLGV